jgi:hypothetical protein
MSGLVAQILALLLAISTLAGAFWGYGAHRERLGATARAAIYDAALNKQQAKAATLLATETARVTAQQTQLQYQLQTQEITDAKSRNTIATLAARVRVLVDDAGRLRDPHAAECGPGGGGAHADTAPGAADRAANGPEVSGLLSAELSGLFFKLTEEADAINLAYASCRADSLGLRAAAPSITQAQQHPR